MKLVDACRPQVEHLGACCRVRLVPYRHTVACFPLKLAPTAANIEAHMEPLYIALWRKQPSERAHACSDTLHARRGRRLKLLGWLESRPWGRLRHRWPWTMEKPRRRTSAMLDMPEAQPRPCVACSRVVPRVAGYRVRLHHTDTRVTHKRPYPLFTPTTGPTRAATCRAAASISTARFTTQNDITEDTADTYTKHARG